ncbi:MULTISPECIES: hypothetical protein [unclassified Thioalkalivibrio]|uniref:hypothetical protein n=1 Tax=unclassified Thioalkalivibrio TaxID=2621013 RepID=UPI0003A4254A|nr:MULTISPECIES: hypothetical protein [unclassified Thioalkalivibrio]
MTDARRDADEREEEEEELRKRRENMQRRSDSQAAAGFDVLHRPNDEETPENEEDGSQSR